MSAPRAHRGVVLAIVLAGYLLVLIDASILIVDVPKIHTDPRFSPTGLSWAQSAYTLNFGGLLLVGGVLTQALSWRLGFLLNIPALQTSWWRSSTRRSFRCSSSSLSTCRRCCTTRRS